jgi:diguanylate cyclase (GGDEF)-like protein
MDVSVPTLILVTTIVTFTTSLLLAISWLQNQAARCLFYWSIANLIGTVAAVLFGKRGVAPDFLSLHGANIALFLSAAINWAGMREFCARPFSWQIVGFAPALWVPVALLTPLDDSLIARTCFSSLVVAGFAFASAFELWRGREEKLVSRYPAMVVLCAHALFFLARIPALFLMDMTDQSNALVSPIVMPVAFETLIYIVAISFLRIALVKERAELQSRRAVATDQLTGVASRRAFFEDGRPVLKRLSDQNAECSVALLDLDHFKAINDEHGHAVGDAVLQEFARRAQMAMGSRVLFARLGGEEFAAILPGLSPEDAFDLVNKASDMATRRTIISEDIEIAITVSIGMAFSHRSGYDLDRLLRHADTALYCAKNNGRNRIECAVVDETSETLKAA